MKPTTAGTSRWIRALLKGLLLGAAVIGGCAAMSPADCTSADWYQLGFRDGLFGLQRQDGVYAAQCSGLDATRYAQGWQEGKWEFDSRTRKE